jgi:hypothetical protein
MIEPLKILAVLGMCAIVWWVGFGVLFSYGVLHKANAGRWSAIYWAAVIVWVVFAELVLR